MLTSLLISLKINSEVLHLLALLSIVGSILTWSRAKSATDAAHTERAAIFIGLWAPTFFALAAAVKSDEKS